MSKRLIWQRTESNIKCPCQILCNKMDEQKGSSKPLLMELRLCRITPIKWADYKTPKELQSSEKLNISHLQVFWYLVWVHILKKWRHKLGPKRQEMIFIGYELGSKGYQFWDTAHWHFEISHDVKFKETHFPAKEMNLTQPAPAPVSSCQIPELDNKSDSSVWGGKTGLRKLLRPWFFQKNSSPVF